MKGEEPSKAGGHGVEHSRLGCFGGGRGVYGWYWEKDVGRGFGSAEPLLMTSESNKNKKRTCMLGGTETIGNVHGLGCWGRV